MKLPKQKIIIKTDDFKTTTIDSCEIFKQKPPKRKRGAACMRIELSMCEAEIHI